LDVDSVEAKRKQRSSVGGTRCCVHAADAPGIIDRVVCICTKRNRKAQLSKAGLSVHVHSETGIEFSSRLNGRRCFAKVQSLSKR
jgi:hypothetical protein